MENKYYLAVEVRPNNYFPINLLDLKIAKGFNSTKLEELDAFTLKFKKEEIIEAIKDANLLNIDNSMPLVIIYYENKYTRKIEVLTKDKVYNMWDLLDKNYTDKRFVNKVINFINHKIDGELFNKIKLSSNKNEFLNNIGLMPYLVQRKLYLYLYG